MTRFALQELQDIIEGYVDREGLRPFAERINVPLGVVRGAKDGRNLSTDSLTNLAKVLGLEFYVGPSRKQRELVSNMFGPSFSNLTKEGKGELVAKAFGPSITAPETPAPITIIDGSDFSPINLHDIQASAGDGYFNPSENVIGSLAFKTSWLNGIGIKPSKASLIYVKGDSMQPTLKDGSMVLIDQQRNEASKKNVYAFCEDGAVYVKRLERLNDETMLVHSDNPDYETRSLVGHEINSIRIIGQVVWSAFTWGPKVPNAFG